MLAVLISWIIISFVLFCSGDFFILLYNKFCKERERYGYFDTQILGLSFITLIISISSLWLPTNHYILLLLGLLSTVHCIINRKRFYATIIKVKQYINPLFLGCIILISVSLALNITFMSNSYDSDFYHLQNIRWNEDYKVIPGLANLEDRFGFNSSYMLISALFSFRFLFGNAIYTLQGLIFLNIIIWALFYLTRSRANIQYIILFPFLFIYLIYGDTFLDNTSTDIIPSLLSFYVIAKTILNPKWLNKQPLLACILPITLITFKLTSAVFCLIALYVIYYLIQKKKIKNIAFIITMAAFIILSWCIRNIIVSGYLVYPITIIDIFSVDWKVPEAVAILQQVHIKEWAMHVFFNHFSYDTFIREISSNKLNILWRIYDICFIILVLSPFISLYTYIRKKHINKNIFIVYLAAFFSVIFGLINAPDIRFISGYLLGITFIIICILTYKVKTLSFPKYKKFIIVTMALGIIFISIKKKNNQILETYSLHKEIFKEAFIKPVAHPRVMEIERYFEEYNMDNTTIYITKTSYSRTWDKLPATNPIGLPYAPFDGNKIQHIKTIELRGSSISDGFRTKKEYIEILKNNIEEYKTEYMFIKYGKGK